MAIEPESGTARTVDPGDPAEVVLAEIRRRGGRVTTTRRLVLRALFEHSGHRTASELAEDLANEVQAYGLDVHLSTIYRFLDELEELGVVSHSHLGHGPAVYDVSPVGHFHLVCQQCGGVTESPDVLLSALASSLKSRYGFSIDAHHFAIAGLCKSCSDRLP
jgi:Fur family ferric uptake transcriptional regulator